MKTKVELFKKTDFSKKIKNWLKNLVDEKLMHIVWHGHAYKHNEMKILWLYVKDKKTALSLTEECTTVNDVGNNLVVVLLDDRDFKKHEKIRSPFVKFNLTKANVLYSDGETEMPKDHYCSYNFEKFRNKYKNNQKLTRSYTDKFVEEQLEGSYELFMKSFGNDLKVAELLLLGTVNKKASLTQRFLVLEKVRPIFKSVFVKQDKECFYLMEQLAFYDAGVYDDWGKALRKVQVKIKNIVLQLIYELKTSFTDSPHQTPVRVSDFEYSDYLRFLTAREEVEEIYCFHETVTYNHEKSLRCFYLLVIVDGEVSKQLQNIMNAAEKGTEEVQFVIIAHNRFYIQEHIGLQQGFYKKVWKDKNRIYSSGYYPSIHWRNSWYADLSQSEGLLRNSSDDSEFIVNNTIRAAQNSLEISSKILRRCIHNLLQINVLYYTDYVPHTTNINTLIQMVRYAGENSEEFDRLVKNIKPVILLFDEDKDKQKKKTIRLEREMLKHVQDFFKIISFT